MGRSVVTHFICLTNRVVYLHCTFMRVVCACECIHVCCSWLLGITKYDTVRRRDVYVDSVEAYVYYNIPLLRIPISTSWAGTGYYSGLVVL